MPLYSNILSNIRKKNGEGEKSPQVASQAKSSSGLKLLQDHLLSKQRLKQQNQLQKKQQQQQAAGRSHSEPNSSHVIISESTLHKPQENEWDPEEEYDPTVPNSYEILQAERLRAEEEKRLAARISSTSSGKKINTNILNVLDELESDDDYNTCDKKCGAGNKGKGGTAIAPPPSLTSSTSPSSSNLFNLPGKVSTPSTSGDAGGCSKAISIMAKMGYKVGSGLGKDEQGISEPLEVEKCGLMTGKILPAAPPQSSLVENQQKKLQVSTEVVSKVLLLQNMVGPGEVDGDLEAETKEECRKYGEVVKCLIFEIPNNLVPSDQAVRIFVEFTRPESTAKAKADLDGRYFGGRIVKASFYSEEKFNKYELGP